MKAQIPPSHTCLPTQHFMGAAITSPPLCKHLRSGWKGPSTSADPEFGSGHWDCMWGQPRADRPHRLPGRFSQHLARVLTAGEAFLAVPIPISLFQWIHTPMHHLHVLLLWRLHPACARRCARGSRGCAEMGNGLSGWKNICSSGWRNWPTRTDSKELKLPVNHQPMRSCVRVQG